jgi:dTDP-4-amino-4,6-dideoxygalactose transaminase
LNIEIPFNRPFLSGQEAQTMQQVIASRQFAGDGPFTRKCQGLLEQRIGTRYALLTTSCTHALEMTALLCDIQKGDEVIMPSFTFVSTANAFALQGARIRFVDIDPATMNLDLTCLEAAINSHTKAVVIMHYAGISVDMDQLRQLTDQHGLWLIEDAAHCIDASFRGQALGSFGHLGTLSFHETKNLHCGEGGALLINDEQLIGAAEQIREKGTNRHAFLRKEVDRYSWVRLGSSYLMNELSAAFLYAQLQTGSSVKEKRVQLWQLYADRLGSLQEKGQIQLPHLPSYSDHNGHIFYIKCRHQEERVRLSAFLKSKGISAYFHYVPLHSAPAGPHHGTFVGEDRFTSADSSRLLRLPLFYSLTATEVEYVCDQIIEFYQSQE